MNNNNNIDTLAHHEFKIDPLMKIGYVSLNISDLQKSIEFYQSKLGFKLLGRSSNDRALLSGNGNRSSHLIKLLCTGNHEFSSGTAKRAGLYHFAILLPERKYLADMLQNLKQRSNEVYFEGLADHLVSESIYIRDPDFNGVGDL